MAALLSFLGPILKMILEVVFDRLLFTDKVEVTEREKAVTGKPLVDDIILPDDLGLDGRDIRV